MSLKYFNRSCYLSGILLKKNVSRIILLEVVGMLPLFLWIQNQVKRFYERFKRYSIAILVNIQQRIKLKLKFISWTCRCKKQQVFVREPLGVRKLQNVNEKCESLFRFSKCDDDNMKLNWCWGVKWFINCMYHTFFVKVMGDLCKLPEETL